MKVFFFLIFVQGKDLKLLARARADYTTRLYNIISCFIVIIANAGKVQDESQFSTNREKRDNQIWRMILAMSGFARISVIFKLETSGKLHSNLRQIWRGRFPSFFRCHLRIICLNSVYSGISKKSGNSHMILSGNESYLTF